MVSLKKLVLFCALLSPSLAFAQNTPGGANGTGGTQNSGVCCRAFAANSTNQYGALNSWGGNIPPGNGIPFVIVVPDQATAGFWRFSAPVLSTSGGTGPAGSGNGGVFVSTATVQSQEFPLGAGPSTFGATPSSTQISIPFIPANSGHVTSLQVSNLSTATCATPPVLNVIDYPGGVSSDADTVGTPLTAPATGAANGTSMAKSAQSLPFNGGDLVFIFVNNAGSGCTGSTFAVSAEVAIP
jgi:hypothetical protein